LLVAVQLQWAWVVTLVLPAPPEAETDATSGEMLNEQADGGDGGGAGAGEAAWLMATGCPATLTVSLRAAAVGATVNITVPLPFPLAGPVRAIHATPLEARHSHPSGLVTPTDTDPPVEPTECVNGATLYVHPSDWETVNRWPATRIVPSRGGPLVATTSKATWPLPFPAAPDRRTIQDSSASACHSQSALDALTSIRPSPPLRGNDAESPSSAKMHSAASCITSMRCSFRTTAPRRDAGSGFGAALNSTAPSP
jgi:hypothetical protein